MKKLIVLILLMLIASPALADRPRLRGPSKAKQRRVIRVNMGHQRHVCRNGCCRSYRLNRNSNRRYLVHRQPSQVVVVVQSHPAPRPKPQVRIAPRPRHKTIFIRSAESTRPARRTHFPHPGRKVPNWVKNCE